MNEPLSNDSRALRSEPITRSAETRTATPGVAPTAPRADDVSVGAVGRPRSDEVLLSDMARRAIQTQQSEEPVFDEAKVAAIRAALQAGNYPLDARRIAESFVAIERMIGE